MRLARLVDVWFALHLTVGIGVMATVSTVVDPPLEVAVGSGATLLVGIVLVRRDPAFDSAPLWHVGLLTVACYVAFRVGTWAVGLEWAPMETAGVLLAIFGSVALYWGWQRQAPGRTSSRAG